MTIFSILGHYGIFGSIFYPQIKINSKNYFSIILIWFSPSQSGLEEYPMIVFSDLIRYFVKMMIFMKK